MPPAAQFEFVTALEEPYDGVVDVGGIEVEAIPGVHSRSVVTRIRILPRDHDTEELPRASKLAGSCLRLSMADSRYGYLAGGHDRCLIDSFDSIDEIEENSNEANLIKSIAAKATIVPYNLHSGLGDPITSEDKYYLDATEAEYLDVLDQHMQDTDPESTSFADMHSIPDDPHPNKNRANMEQIMEHLLDNPCCECAPDMQRPLRSAIRPSRWQCGFPTFTIIDMSSPAISRSVKFKEVNIREFEMTLGNHPSATSGPPVMLDWDRERVSNVLDLETYEKSRQPRRNRRQLKLSLQQRHNILVKERGFSFAEVKQAWQEALEIRKKRKETLERGLALMKWDEMWESTCRKFSRLVDGSA